MKTLAAAIAVILFASALSQAQWKKDGKPVEDKPDRKSVGTFGGHLLVVKNPRAFIEDWKKPKMPQINPATSVQRGEQFGIFVLFVGCKADAQGMCNSEIDYFIYRPDGSLYSEKKALPLWKEQAPPSPNIQLGRAIVAIRMEKNDPAGEYKVKAKVSDLNAAISFELETEIRLK